jgi:DNA-binding IclR family transcriptional regulator
MDTIRGSLSDAAGSTITHRAPAVARAASVLRLLASQRGGLGVTEIARRVGLVPSTCLHILRALVEEDFVSFDEQAKTYSTSAGLVTLVREVMASSEFPRAVQPVLEGLAAEFGVTALALERIGTERIVIVAIARADNFVSLHLNVGARLPAFAGAAGRCIAAASGLDREQLKVRFEAVRWEKAPRFDDWFAEVERAKEEGIAVDRGNFMRGLTVVATALTPGSDRAVRAIALIGFEHQMTERTVRLEKAALMQAKQQLATRLG